MSIKEILAPTLSGKQYTERFRALHKQVYASPPFEFDAVASHIYSPPPEYHAADHCLVHDGNQWHLYYITGITKEFDNWKLARLNNDREANVKYLFEVGDGHAVGDTLEQLKFVNHVLANPRGKYALSTQCNLHVVRFQDHWVGLYQIRGPEGFSIGAARSTDLYDWIPDPDNPAFGIPKWAHQSFCKDVHIFPWKGAFLVYYIVTGVDNLQAVGLQVTADFRHYVDIGPVYKVPLMARGTRGIESPCVFERNGIWHLFFGWGMYGAWHVVSNRPDSFHGVDPGNGSDTAELLDYGAYAFAPFHAAEIVHHQDEWFVTTTKKEQLRRQDCENRVLKYRGTYEDEFRLSHGIYMSRLRWEGDYPICVKP